MAVLIQFIIKVSGWKTGLKGKGTEKRKKLGYRQDQVDQCSQEKWSLLGRKEI